MPETTPSRRGPIAIVAAVAAVVFALCVAGFAWGPQMIAAASGAPQTTAPERAERSVFPLAADFCYAQMMIPHHRQAVEMSEILLAKPDVSDRSAALAEFISRDQTSEVTATEAWIQAWRTEFEAHPPMDAPVAAASAGHHGGTPPPAAPATPLVADPAALVSCGAEVPGAFDAMPGMLSAEQLDALRAAPTHVAEVLYLQLMIPHHEGALEMSREVIVDGGNSYTIGMAKHILNEQQREIQAMVRMIEEIA